MKNNEMDNIIISNLSNLFESKFDEKVLDINKLERSGSPRKYYRINSKSYVIIGAYNTDKKENNAFITLSEHFYQENIQVPRIYAYDPENNIYLQEDLGQETLFDRIKNTKKESKYPTELTKIYKIILGQLIDIQIYGGKNLDYSVCYPRENFDKQSMMWDLNYFKYFFLKLADIQFDEQLLENDFQKFTDFLLKTDTKYFLFRDFQSRNIMLKGNKVFFIDYQGGRRGALQYDLASLLFDAKADIPENIREELKNHYLKSVKKHIEIDEKEFTKYYYGYALIRVLQAMGAYGYRGFFERKSHFLQSIPFALNNLEFLISKVDFINNTKELKDVLSKITKSKKLKEIGESAGKLKVTIKSFSYKKAIPYDPSGNGGGFVFDCRFLDNPGRIDKFKHLSGIGKEVKKYLEKNKEVSEFINLTQTIVKKAVENYQKRNFSDLSVNYGCTGGQHRSVYSVEKMAEFLIKNYDLEIDIVHTEKNNW